MSGPPIVSNPAMRVRRNLRGFFSYLLLYQLVMSPVRVVGYVQELFRTKRNW